MPGGIEAWVCPCNTLTMCKYAPTDNSTLQAHAIHKSAPTMYIPECQWTCIWWNTLLTTGTAATQPTAQSYAQEVKEVHHHACRLRHEMLRKLAGITAIRAGIECRVREIELQKAQLSRSKCNMLHNRSTHLFSESDCRNNPVRQLGHFIYNWTVLWPAWNAWAQAHDVRMWMHVQPVQIPMFPQWLTTWMQTLTGARVVRRTPDTPLQFSPTVFETAAPAQTVHAHRRAVRSQTRRTPVPQAHLQYPQSKRRIFHDGCRLALGGTIALDQALHTTPDPYRRQSRVHAEQEMGAWAAFGGYAGRHYIMVAVWNPTSWTWHSQYGVTVQDIQRTMARHTQVRSIFLAPQDWWDDPEKLRPLYHPQELHKITCAQAAHTYNSLPMASRRPRNHPARDFTAVHLQHTAMPHPDWGPITNHLGHAVFR